MSLQSQGVYSKAMLWAIVGIIAATLTTLGFFPQALKIYRTRSSKDVSLHTLVQFLIGVVLWMFYGIHIKDIIVISANAVSLAVIAITMWLYFRYRA